VLNQQVVGIWVEKLPHHACCHICKECKCLPLGCVVMQTFPVWSTTGRRPKEQPNWYFDTLLADLL